MESRARAVVKAGIWNAIGLSGMAVVGMVSHDLCDRVWPGIRRGRG